MGIIQVKGGFVHKNAMSPEAMQRMRQVVRRSFTRAVPQDGDPDRRVWYRRYLLYPLISAECFACLRGSEVAKGQMLRGRDLKHWVFRSRRLLGRGMP